ncbi:putative damage-inducible protein DinB [Paenibacillus shirakamiensis]|uniref:Damage-inducible protein DinB n=1 Tax=Paenibacillus shirakamiensis TaxID=1265935 RepID=A0ABS4JHF0_9BACL|nr:DinB family protein [Paenibacillus shirakamiensis]MBP2001137.1 putative damage-inducible protein DinB [Paenibacillus shirakamiensis]
MFTSIQAFEQAWQEESKMTQKIFDELTDESLAQGISPNHRTIGRIAWHLVTTLHEMLSKTGLAFEAPLDDAPLPDTAKAIASCYQQSSQALLQAVQSQWTDASLQQKVNMYGEEWPNGLTLWVLVTHQIHHRGQLTVLMRQAGLQVPGLYGPSLEEWIAFGAEPPVI